MPRLRRSAGLVLALAFLASAAHATNNNNVTIPLSGKVPSGCYIADNASGATTVFDLTKGASNVLIGTIIEDCNEAYLVALTTTNSANFLGGLTGTLVPYTLAYNSAPVVFTQGIAVVTLSFAGTGKSGVSKPLTITFAPGYYVADSYADLITLTMISD